ncbi:MAG: hypothetical protein WED87_06580 [Dehalococcoidia bacterium]
MSDIPPGGLPQHRKLVERCRAAAEAESADARARQWRDVDVDTRTRVFAGLFDMAVLLSRDRVVPYKKPPLNYPCFSTTS